MSSPTARPPLFIALEPSGADALGAPTCVAWACAADAGVVTAAGFAAACRTIAALEETRAVYLRDPLFDAPRLDRLFAENGLRAPSAGRDWLLALAPFGQARNFAAILEAATESAADPTNPALVLLEAYDEAAARAARRAGQTPVK